MVSLLIGIPDQRGVMSDRAEDSDPDDKDGTGERAPITEEATDAEEELRDATPPTLSPLPELLPLPMVPWSLLRCARRASYF